MCLLGNAHDEDVHLMQLNFLLATLPLSLLTSACPPVLLCWDRSDKNPFCEHLFHPFGEDARTYVVDNCIFTRWVQCELMQPLTASCITQSIECESTNALYDSIRSNRKGSLTRGELHFPLNLILKSLKPIEHSGQGCMCFYQPLKRVPSIHPYVHTTQRSLHALSMNCLKFMWKVHANST